VVATVRFGLARGRHLPDALIDRARRTVGHRGHPGESIEAHLSIVFAALAVSHWIERQTGRSIKKLVQTLRRYRTVTIRVGNQTLIAADPLPADLQEAVATITTHADTLKHSRDSGTATEVRANLTSHARSPQAYRLDVP
jgi:hypothetical protein